MIDEIGDFLNHSGIPIFGTAKARTLTEVPAEFSPQSIMKGARSVLCFAVPTPKGIIQAENNFSLLYWRFCNISYRFLDSVANGLCLLLEQKGFTAAPVYSCFPWKVLENRFYGLMPLVWWARECGIARLTPCGLAGNSRFGVRLLLGGVISGAEFENTGAPVPDPCPPDCALCRESCPVGAIDRTGRVDHNRCVRHSGANPLLANLLADKSIVAKFGFETLLNTVSVDDHGMYTCSECLRACPLNR
ncbi:MAG: hypothetical protein WAW37_14540 [Syntrophobacteraceae bacterium]